MPKYNVYNATGAWLGTVAGDDEKEALQNAQAQHPDAQRVELRPEEIRRDRP